MNSSKGQPLNSVRFTRHFIKQARHKGFTAEQIQVAIEQSDKPKRLGGTCDVTRVTKYEGQRRYMGAGVAVVMDGNSAITIYADEVVTPMREDRRNDPSAQNSRRLARFNSTVEA